MLIPGIKLGPKDWREKLDQSQADFAEIWYRVDKPEWYRDLFTELHNRQVRFGLHFWGQTSTGHEANLAHPLLTEESEQLIAKCLKLAGQAEATYVNIHSGNYAAFMLNFDHGQPLIQDELIPVVDPSQSARTRDKALLELDRLACNDKVQLLVESIPASIPVGGTGWMDKVARDTPASQCAAPINSLISIYQETALGFTNDACHLFSAEVGDDRQKLCDIFWKKTKIFAPFTHLVHVNTLWPPYNGTDAHGGILTEDFNRPGVFPNQSEWIQLFELLSTNPFEVYLVGEPADNHVENYLALKTMLQKNDL